VNIARKGRRPRQVVKSGRLWDAYYWVGPGAAILETATHGHHVVDAIADAFALRSDRAKVRSFVTDRARVLFAIPEGTETSSLGDLFVAVTEH
jgi:hypothetical protein